MEHLDGRLEAEHGLTLQPAGEGGVATLGGGREWGEEWAVATRQAGHACVWAGARQHRQGGWAGSSTQQRATPPSLRAQCGLRPLAQGQQRLKARSQSSTRPSLPARDLCCSPPILSYLQLRRQGLLSPCKGLQRCNQRRLLRPGVVGHEQEAAQDAAGRPHQLQGGWAGGRGVS